ncbi:MAG: hypothetical protein WC538_15830 [Thermoanaerobaculia bacterium]
MIKENALPPERIVRRIATVVSISMLSVVLSGVAVPAEAAKASPSALKMSFSSGRVVVEGATPSGEIAWVQVARKTKDFATSVQHATDLSPCDATGRCEMLVAGGVPFSSVWVAIDTGSGAYIAGAPSGGAIQMTSSPFANGLQPGSTQARPDRFETTRRQLQISVVRPKQGVWKMIAARGGMTDEDRARPGWSSHPLARMTPVTASAGSLDVLKPHDVVVAIDAVRMSYYVVEILPQAN